MQLAFHLGAHATDDERLMRTLAANPEALAAARTVAPAPKQYRAALRDALIALKGRPADEATQKSLLTTCAGGTEGEVARLVFSHENFLALPDRAIGLTGLYPAAADKLGPLANLFPEAETEFHLGLLNPAVLLNALVARQNQRSYDEILAGQSPDSLRWLPVIERMAGTAKAAGARLVLWCDEDMPLIFPEVLRSLGGLAATSALNGEDVLLQSIMSDEGLSRMRAYLAQHPVQSIAQRRKVVMAFLDKFARADALEAEITLPGWTSDLVARMSESYEADVAQISQIEGVTFLAP